MCIIKSQPREEHSNISMKKMWKSSESAKFLQSDENPLERRHSTLFRVFLCPRSCPTVNRAGWHLLKMQQMMVVFLLVEFQLTLLPFRGPFR
mmetsp:Transcript_3725/g.14149  ORF Transcript_3725/g.14149 Transcript_3725/m.14149 type:complete len:92 (-) Transcript_3725:2376-2651(-)